MVNINGQLLSTALQTIDRPATFSDIVKHIEDAAGFPPHDIRESIQDTLNGGFFFGFIQRSNQKYSVAHFPADVAAVAEVNKQPAEAEAAAVAVARKDGDEKMDKNQNNQLEEKRKRKKGGKKKRAAARRKAAPRRYKGY